MTAHKTVQCHAVKGPNGTGYEQGVTRQSFVSKGSR